MWNIDDMALPARKAIRVWAGDVEVMVKQVEKGKHYAISEVPETAKVAHLIAAAPGLLAALEAILPVFDNDGTSIYAKVYAKEIKAAEKAIAKAGGKQHG